MPNYVPGVGSISPKLMIVGEAPGKHEDEQCLPFVGPSGGILNECLSKAGISRSECWITNVSKFRPPYNDFSALHIIGVNLGEQIESLWNDEIKKLKPNCILAVGNEALKALTGLTGIMNYRGSILSGRDGYKVVPTIHPTALFSRTGEDGFTGGLNYTYLKLIEFDIQRAVEESTSPEISIPDRTLQVIHNSLDLYRFFSEYTKLDKLAVDIESINCIPVSIGFAFNKHHAVSVPLLRKIGKFQLTDMSIMELAECWKLIDNTLRRCKLIGHNFKYDEFKLGRIGFECPTVLSDTLIKVRVIFPELPTKRLCDLSSIWTREPFYKDEGREFKLGKHDISRLLLYNAKDCAVTYEVDEAMEQDLDDLSNKYSIPLRNYYYEYMMKKHKLYLKMENVGFRVDHTRKNELKKLYTNLVNEVHTKITNLLGYEVNVKSYPDVFNLLYKDLKFKVRKQNPTSEDSIIALLNQTKDKHRKEILTSILQERRIRDQLSRYINFIPDYDGRCKTIYNISATETCRSSTQILKKPIRPKKIGLPFHTIAAHGELGKHIKSMLIPDPGMVFIKADASQAEARVVAVLSCDWELLDAFDKVDIHRRTAGLIFSYTKNLELSPSFSHKVVDSLAKDSPERFTGKMVRHAGNYDMGYLRFATEFNTSAQKFNIPLTISNWAAKDMLVRFHAASPKIRSTFHREVREALESTRVLIDPFGGIRMFNGRMGEELFKEGYANIPQRTVAHLVQGAALRISDEIQDDNAVFIGEKHDELIMQVPEKDIEMYARLLKKHMEVPIDFSQYCTLKRDYRLVIPCEVEYSNTHYGDFKKITIPN